MSFNTSVYQASQNIHITSKISEVLSSFVPLLIIMLIFYFLMIRPQQKKIIEHKKMLDTITTGHTILTSGGIIAKVIKIDDTSNIITAEISLGIYVKIKKYTINKIIE